MQHQPVNRFGQLKNLIYTLLLICAAQRVYAAPSAARERVMQLIEKGNEVYSRKTGYSSFLQSLRYFDSARVLAEKSDDALLLAETTFAIGRVYDAWNKQPDKTIEYFRKAMELFKQVGATERYFYVKHLVAHAYDKTDDSLSATRTLREMAAELKLLKPAQLKRLEFTTEMALIATEVQAYALADSLLHTFTVRANVKNNPETYNYLDHYYLTQSRLDVFWRSKYNTPFLDSLEAVYNKPGNFFDSLFYSRQLMALYGKARNYKKAFEYNEQFSQLHKRSTNRAEVVKMQIALERSELAAENRQKEYQRTLQKGRAKAIWTLSLLLLIITILSFYLYRRNKKYKEQTASLNKANAELDHQIAQVEILNKEMQHRIKNNLYTIYSLLHMQEEHSDNEEVIAHLQSARLRVESIATLHNQLIRHENEPLDFETYIKELIAKIIECFNEDRNIIAHIHTQPLSLSLNTHFAVSLILNEWITNSVKYARREDNTLELHIRIEKENAFACVEYADSGNARQDGPPSDGLGSQIVKLLCLQIRATLKTDPHKPYHYKLLIPYEQQ